MRIFRRIGGILTAKVNDIVDQCEEPDVLLRQAIREMDLSLENTTSAAAKAIAGETMLAKQQAEHERQAIRWHSRAKDAVAAGDDALARKALARKLDHERLAETIATHSASAQDASRRLRRQVDTMRTQLAETRQRLATLIARQKAAEARKALLGAPSNPGLAPSSFARFESVRERVERAEAEADAMVELYDGESVQDEAEFDAREEQRRIDAELAALKA